MAGRREERATEVHLSERLRVFVFERGAVLLLLGDQAVRLTDLEARRLVEAHARLARPRP